MQQKRAKNKEAERLRNLEKMEADRKASGVVRQVGKRDMRGPGFMPGGGFGTRLPAAGQPTVTSPQEGGRNIFSKTAGAVRDRAGDVVGAVRDKAGDVTGFAGRKVKGAAGAINRAIRGQDETSRTKIGVGTDRLGVGLSGDTREQRQDKSQFSAGLGKARTDKIQADRERTDQYQYAGYQLGPYAGDPRAETKLTERPVAKATTQTADSLKRGSGFMPGGGLGTRLPAAGDSSADTKPRPFSDTREGTDTTIIADPFGQRNRKKEQRARDTQRTATPQEAKDVGRGTLQDTMFGGNRPDAAFVDPESKRILEGPAAGVTQAAGQRDVVPRGVTDIATPKREPVSAEGDTTLTDMSGESDRAALQTAITDTALVPTTADSLEVTERFLPQINESAENHGVPPDIIRKMIYVESSGRPAIINEDSGSVGLLQITPIAAKDLGIAYDVEQLSDPAYNIEQGTKFLKLQYDRVKRANPNLSEEELWRQAVTAYHAGFGNLQKGNLGPKSRQYPESVFGSNAEEDTMADSLQMTPG